MLHQKPSQARLKRNLANPCGRGPLTALSLAETITWGPMRGRYRAELHPGPTGRYLTNFISLRSSTSQRQVPNPPSKFTCGLARHAEKHFIPIKCFPPVLHCLDQPCPFTQTVPFPNMHCFIGLAFAFFHKLLLNVRTRRACQDGIIWHL